MSAFTVLPIEVLPDYIVNSIEKFVQLDNPDATLIIYHFIVGSYAYHADIENPNPKYKRNHEFPQVVKNLLYNTELQFSPEMQEYISHYENFTIIQKLFLIDPIYERSKIPIGFQKVIMQHNEVINDGKITKEYEIQHNEFKKTQIQSILEPVIIPYNIDEKQILEITEIISRYTSRYKVLINLMDCSSHTLLNFYIHNKFEFVYLSTPDCLLQDDTIPYMPVITITEDQNHHKKIRWCNYELDGSNIENYKIVMDICKNSKITYNFLINVFKRKRIEINLLAICKFLGILTVTKEYTLSNNKVFRFSKLTFYDFIELWQLQEFQNIFLSNFDPYYKINIAMYIDILISSVKILENIDKFSSIKNILLQEVWNILKQLKEFFPEDTKIPFPESHILIDRFMIREFLELNGVYQ